MHKYWKKTITAALLTAGIAAGGGYVTTIVTKLQHNLASLVQNSNDDVFFEETQFYSAASSTTHSRRKYVSPLLQSNQEKKNDYAFRDALTIASFASKVNEDILMTEEPEFIPKIKAKDYGLNALCTGACVYVEMRGGYSKYNLKNKQTTFAHKVCDEDSDGKPFCNIEEYVMEEYYLVINKEGEINEYGKIESNNNNIDNSDYVKVFNEEEYDNLDYNSDYNYVGPIEMY
ncbi:MAG: hypothetical protein Q8R37_02905 [Nanoarchaeota archaeon]|nr:hypothetical protein [Nanoarchaeota archaeon]